LLVAIIILIVKKKYLLSLVIPAYKQEKIIIENLRKLINELELIRYDYEIIIVIDGQVDNTLERLKKSNLKKIKIISYQKNRGKSYAIRLGMSKANGDYIMFIDAGLEINPNGISMLLEHMEWYEADIIVGSKRHPASKVNYNWQRKILSFGYYYVVRFLFGVRVRDTQAGIKIFKKEVVEKVLPRLVEKRFAGDLELLVVANSLGFKRVFEAPIKLDYDFSSLSSAVTIQSIFGIFLDTLAIFYRSKILNYYKNIHVKMISPNDLEITILK